MDPFHLCKLQVRVWLGTVNPLLLSSLFTTKQTAAACSLQLSTDSLVRDIYWAISSSDSANAVVITQIKVGKEKDLKKRIGFTKEARKSPYRCVCSEQGPTNRRQGRYIPGWAWLGISSSRYETQVYNWNHKAGFQKARTTLKPSKSDTVHFQVAYCVIYFYLLDEISTAKIYLCRIPGETKSWQLSSTDVDITMPGQSFLPPATHTDCYSVPQSIKHFAIHPNGNNSSTRA